MTSFKVFVLATILLLAIEFAWLARWEMAPASAIGAMYQLDRWTGTVYVMFGMNGRQRIENKTPK